MLHYTLEGTTTVIATLKVNIATLDFIRHGLPGAPENFEIAKLEACDDVCSFSARVSRCTCVVCSRSCYFRTTSSGESTSAIVCCSEIIVSFSGYKCCMCVHVSVEPSVGCGDRVTCVG